MQNLDNIIVAGIKIALNERGRGSLKGITVDDSMRYNFYDFSFQGSAMLLLVSKLSKETPLQYQRRAARLSAALRTHIVFYFDRLDYYEKKDCWKRACTMWRERIMRTFLRYLPHLQPEEKPLDTFRLAASTFCCRNYRERQLKAVQFLPWPNGCLTHM